MPRSRRYRRADGLPGTLRRSCREAQEAFTKALDEAVRVYGEGDRAYRAAFTAAGGAGGGTPKGLAGKRRRVAARAGFIMTSMSP